MNPIRAIGDLISAFGESERVRVRGENYDLRRQAGEIQNALQQSNLREKKLSEAAEIKAALDANLGTGMTADDAVAAYRAKRSKTKEDLDTRVSQALIEGRLAEAFRDRQPPKPGAFPNMQKVRTEKGIDYMSDEQIAAYRSAGGRFLEEPKTPPASFQFVTTDQGIVAGNRRTGALGPVVGQPKVPAGEERKRAESGSMISLLQGLESLPDEMLGPKRAFGAKVRSGMAGELLGMDQPPPEYADAQARVGIARDQIVHALTGAAASVPEMARLAQHIPDLKQRPNVFRSNVRITRTGLQIIEKLNAGEITPEEAGLMVTQVLGGGGQAPGAGNLSPDEEALLHKYGY